MQTRCPACTTTFHLPIDHVLRSRGEVRCGECQIRFNAIDHLVTSEGTTHSPTPRTTLLTDRSSIELPSAPQNTHFLPISAAAIQNLLTDEIHPLDDGLAILPALTPIGQKTVAVLEDKGLTTQITHYQTAIPTIPPPLSHSNSWYWHGMALLLLLLLLGSQYLYLQRSSLADSASWRPLVAQLCRIAPCQLPLQRDTTQLEIYANRVESHPQQQGVLLITAQLANHANFAQPVPDIMLVLSDLHQEVIASRRFHPIEFLPLGSSIDQLPPQSEQSLLLEIIDPGSHPTGFELQIR